MPGATCVAIGRPSRLWSGVTAPTPMTRARAYAILRPYDNSAGARRWRTFHFCVLSAGLLAVALSSIDDLPDVLDRALAAVIVLVAIIFLFEYIVRLWAIPESPRYAGMSEGRARLHWALSVSGLIGLLAVLPAFGITTGAVNADSDMAAIFCLLWVLRLGLYAPAMETLARVVSNERA